MTTTVLAAYLLAAMKAWVPLAHHSYYEAPVITETRYAAVADDIAAEVLVERPLFEDEHFAGEGAVRTAVLLASIASFESQFRSAVVFCNVAGDNGRAFGPFQSHEPKDRVCLGTRGAVKVALEQLRDSLGVCRSAPFMDRLGIYTDGPAGVVEGRCRSPWSRSRVRMKRAMDYLRAHPWA